MRIQRCFQAVCAMVVAVSIGCAASGPRRTLYTPTFASPIPITESRSPSQITIALINPVYAPELEAQLKETGEHEYSRLFRQSLGKELEKLLIAKGFNLSGPFADFSEMTYPQKKQADLVLHPVMDFVFKQPGMKEKEATNWGSLLLGGDPTKTVYVWEGSCSISGFLTFEVWEPLSGQKMWVKKVDISPIEEDCTAKGVEEIQLAYANALGKLLERVYRKAIIKADTYFNREEMELVKTQSLELRAKKVY